MPPELKRGSRQELIRVEEQFGRTPPGTERFDSEDWEKERDAVIDEVAKALETNILTDVEAFELTCIMSRHSLKDGLALAKKTQLDGASVADLLREYGGKHDAQQKLVAGQPLRERILQFVDYRSASPLSFVASNGSWRDREKRADEFIACARDFVDKDPELELKIKTLLREDSDKDPNRPGGSGITAPSFDQSNKQILALKDKIDRLYEPFYDNPSPEGAGKPKIREISPLVSEANEYLREWTEIASSKPVFFVPVQEWLFKRLFNTKAVITGLRWPDIEVESAIAPGKKLPLREAVKEYHQASKNGDINHDWALERLFAEPVENQTTTISLKILPDCLKYIGIDPAQLDVQGLIKRNSVTKLELTFKIRCRQYADALTKERQQLEQKRAVLKARKRSVDAVEYDLRATQELERMLAQLAKGEMDIDALNKRSFHSAANRSFTGDVQERNLTTAIQSRGILETLRNFTNTEAREARPAKYDHFSRTEMEGVFQQVFPAIELAELKRRRTYNRAERDITTKRHEAKIWNAESYFDPEDESYGVDGDPKEAYPKELMKISQPVDAILVTGVYDTRDENEGRWKTTNTTHDTDSPHDLPRTTAIFELAAKVGMVLPVALHGIHDPHVIGITDKGKQVPVVVKKDAVGRLIVESFPSTVQRIAYAQEVPALLPAVTDVSEQVYTIWQAQREKHGEDKGRQTPEQAFRLLPTDCKKFVEEVRSLAPAERVRHIERFVRAIGYYDFRNGETEGERVGTSLKVRWELMRQRMKLLQAESPKDPALAAKKIAGVCVDFQELTTTLLRAAGCIAGKLSALRVHNETKVTSQDAHALSYVEWPTDNGGSMRIPVDGTPNGTNAEEEKVLDRIQEATQEERADKLAAHRFEDEMEINEEGQQKAPAALEKEQEPLRKQPPTPLEEMSVKKKPPSQAKERMTEYLRTSLSAQETHALYRLVSWMAYSGALEELAQLGDTPSAFHREGQIKMEIAQIYTDGLKETMPQTRTDESASIVRDWEHAYHKVRASRYTPTRLAALVADALPRATDTKSRRDRSITYLGKIV